MEYLVGLGATTDDLLEFRDELPVTASMLALRPKGARLSLAQLAERGNIEPDVVANLWRAFGLPYGGLDAPVAYEETADLLTSFQAGLVLFGEDVGMQLARMLGELMAGLADALISAFIVSIGAPASVRDPTLLALAEENARAAALVEPFMHALEVLLRHHLELARRPLRDVAAGEAPGYDARYLAIGFADLTGSTALAGRVSFAELGRTLGRFESRAATVVNATGGRIVKLIGDEVMFSAPTVDAACDIAITLVGEVEADDNLPPLRAGVAAGDVLVRYGDCFGPVVNLAARLVAQAEPSTVVAPAALAHEIDTTGRFVASPIGSTPLRGFDEDVGLAL
ncbi:MAG: adenylate/guanylate cyclase, partial [Actinomycetia bacterium]|nr:adenylate/guanylate cyclase [Actinomycetes bacterium]